MQTFRAVVENEAGASLERRGLTSEGARSWALQALPDANKLTLYDAKRSRGWYLREGGSGQWVDADIWGKSV